MKIADDSVRISVIIPMAVRDEIFRVADTRTLSVSDIVREFILIGIEREKRKWQANQDSI